MSAPTEPLFELSDVTVTRAGKPLLDAVNWVPRLGQHWVVLGPNGAGKTTLAGILAGRVEPTSGAVTILGYGSDDVEGADLASRVGFASAEVGDRLLPSETAISVILTSAWGQALSFSEEYDPEDVERAHNLMEALGIDCLSDHPYGTLSEGERRRVLIARALMADPEILILDEPTAGLDLGGRETLLLALAEIMDAPSSPSVILITHELEEIGPQFTHALLLNSGAVAAAGPLTDVITDQNLTDVFGLPVQVTRHDGRWWATAQRP